MIEALIEALNDGTTKIVTLQFTKNKIQQKYTAMCIHLNLAGLQPRDLYSSWNS